MSHWLKKTDEGCTNRCLQHLHIQPQVALQRCSKKLEARGLTVARFLSFFISIRCFHLNAKLQKIHFPRILIPIHRECAHWISYLLWLWPTSLRVTCENPLQLLRALLSFHSPLAYIIVFLTRFIKIAVWLRERSTALRGTRRLKMWEIGAWARNRNKNRSSSSDREEREERELIKCRGLKA